VALDLAASRKGQLELFQKLYRAAQPLAGRQHTGTTLLATAAKSQAWENFDWLLEQGRRSSRRCLPD
jgi:hypothetical protein